MERKGGTFYGSTERRWCEVNGGRLRVYDANKAREVATIHIRAERQLIGRLTEDEVRRVGRAPQWRRRGLLPPHGPRGGRSPTSRPSP